MPFGLEDLELDDYLFPSETEDLLGTSGNPAAHARLDLRRGSVFGHMEGYRQAAIVLTEHALDHHSKADLLIYPIANSWRHHLELLLKFLLSTLQEFAGEPVTRPFGHDLLKLWRQVRVKLEEAKVHESAEDLHHAERLIRQLHELDPDGQDFRYDCRRDLTPSLASVNHLDLQAFHDGLSLDPPTYVEVTV